MKHPPVVFFIFRRPELTKRVFSEIAKFRPEHLVIVADGPRFGVAGEGELVAQTRSVVENVDWPCTVTRIYSDTNLGLRQRLLTGLDEAFALHERLIILEDDCLPSQSFFSFVTTMLEHFEDRSDLAIVSGSNFAPYKAKHDYHFSEHPYIWGWGTWAHVWKSFRSSEQTDSWPPSQIQRIRSGFSVSAQGRNFANLMVHSPKLNTWDISFAVWVRHQKLLSIVPRENLIENIGFGLDATHTKFESFDSNLPAGNLEAPYVGPSIPTPDYSREKKMWMVKRLRWITFPLSHPILFMSRVLNYLLK